MHAAQRAVGSPGTARNRRALDEGKLLRQRDQSARRHFEEFGMSAVGGHAVDHDAFTAELRPADAAMLAHPAARVMVVHHALADWRFALRNAGTAGGDDAAGLVAGDERLGVAAQAERLLRLSGWRA